MNLVEKIPSSSPKCNVLSFTLRTHQASWRFNTTTLFAKHSGYLIYYNKVPPAVCTSTCTAELIIEIVYVVPTTWLKLKYFLTFSFKAFVSFVGKVPPAAEHWQGDRFYGAHFLNGCNPDTIRRCAELPSKFPVTQEMVGNLLDRGDTLQKAIQVRPKPYSLSIPWIPRQTAMNPLQYLLYMQFLCQRAI